MMKIIITKNAQEMGKEGAKIFAEQIRSKPDSVLGLATGSTPIPCYQELARMHKEENLDFSKITTFNLDEYIGISESDANSYHYFMNNELFQHINVDLKNIHIPDGNAEDIDLFAKQYDEWIQFAGGIDIQLLGIGENGHIGFNEPAEELMTGTGRVQLAQSTINANARFFDIDEEVPKEAITMGMKTIMVAKKIVIIASGVKKHDVVKRLAGKEFLSTKMPVSLLFLHSDCTLIVDEAAYNG